MSDTKAQSITDRLTSTERDRRFPNVRPKDAATLIIIDRQDRTPKVLMGRRHPGHKFMPGKFVFPGGRIEPGDRSMSVAGTLHARAEQALMARVQRPSAQRSRALALAAIRETFEETGLLLGTKEHGAPETVPTGAWTVTVYADGKRLHKDVAPRLVELGATIGSLLEGADGELFSNRLERKSFPAATHNNNKMIKTEDTDELEAGARRPRPARSVRAGDGRR